MPDSPKWKKNFLKVPQHLLSKLNSLDTNSYVVAAALTVREQDTSLYRVLELPKELGIMSTVQPPPASGKYSKRNVEGWEVKRTDLPKIEKTFSWETPNFGDGAKYGYHIHFQQRDVFQREFREPPFYTITSQLLKQGLGASVYQVRVDQVFNRTAANMEEELLFAINLLQENSGVADVQRADASHDEFISTVALDWEVFPPGSSEDLTKAILRDSKHSLAAKDVKDRVELFNSLKPKSFLRGQGGFGAYIGALYDDDLVVFENLKYGNALYILYEDWKAVSKRSRIDLIKGTDANFDRIVHQGEWKALFKRLIKDKLRSKKR